MPFEIPGNDTGAVPFANSRRPGRHGGQTCWAFLLPLILTLTLHTTAPRRKGAEIAPTLNQQQFCFKPQFLLLVVMSALREWMSAGVTLVRLQPNEASASPSATLNCPLSHWCGLQADICFPPVSSGCSLSHTTGLSLFRLGSIFSPKQHLNQHTSVSYFTVFSSIPSRFSSHFLFLIF